ncbi:MAG: ABC transporter substrate-binding protein [Clostridiales bacterium]|nr:ABC transporter substrate-binding protein [Clostridiales bacterium]
MKRKIGLKKVSRGVSIVLTAGLVAGSLSFAALAAEIDTSRTSTANSDERYEKVTVAIPSDPVDLGPTGYGDNSAQYTSKNYFESLFDFRDNDYVPIMTTGYTEVDELTWDVELYDYITDSDGNNITASDVVFSYQLLIDAGKAMKFDTFESVEAVDDYTVRFHWTKAIDSVGELEWPLCRVHIVSEQAYNDHAMASDPVGTGPYVVTEYVAGAKIVMEANDNYWQTDELCDVEHLANVQTLEYDIISETSQHVIALSTDQIQYTEQVPSENLADFEEGGQYADGHLVYETQGSTVEVLFPNCYDGKITADVNLRMAIFYAIDNEAVAMVAGTYDAAKAFGTPFFSDYNEEWESAEGNYMAVYDLDKAKEYLDQSSYNGEELVLLCPTDEASKSACTMIQTMLLQVGINVTINSEDGTLLETDMLDPANWDLLYKDIGGGSQVGEWNRPMNNEEFGDGYNMAKISDDTLQSYLLECATVEGHTEENMTMLHDYILENAYYYAVCTPRMTAVYSDDFASLVYRESEFLRPGSCDYYLD